MHKKSFLFLLLVIPCSYLLFALFGWLSYFILGGNPTFSVPFGTLVLIFGALNILIAAGLTRLLKIYTLNVLLLAVIEIVVLYLFLWYFLR